MADLLKNKKIIIVCLIMIIAVLGSYNISNNREYLKKEPLKYENNDIEKYEANTYIPIYVTESDIANKYLNDYKNIILSDISYAYDLLNNEYKNSKFETLNKFTEYINRKINISFYNLTVKEYSVFKQNGSKFYYIIASNEDKYIFKELSIMNYEVYLDDYTVELK